MASGLRLIVFDRSCMGRFGVGLSTVWGAGRHLYRALGRTDGARGVSNFDDALSWLCSYRADQPIAEVQFWAHGKWGRLFLDRESLDRFALAPGHPLLRGLSALRERLAPNALLWIRTCETFGAAPGHDFARALTDFFGCPAAGHTFVIGYWQSGLHLLEPGNAPLWSASEGLVRGSPERPEVAAWSSSRAPNTITCLAGNIPNGW